MNKIIKIYNIELNKNTSTVEPAKISIDLDGKISDLKNIEVLNETKYLEFKKKFNILIETLLNEEELNIEKDFLKKFGDNAYAFDVRTFFEKENVKITDLLLREQLIYDKVKEDICLLSIFDNKEEEKEDWDEEETCIISYKFGINDKLDGEKRRAFKLEVIGSIDKLYDEKNPRDFDLEVIKKESNLKKTDQELFVITKIVSISYLNKLKNFYNITPSFFKPSTEIIEQDKISINIFDTINQIKKKILYNMNDDNKNNIHHQFLWVEEIDNKKINLNYFDPEENIKNDFNPKKEFKRRNSRTRTETLENKTLFYILKKFNLEKNNINIKHFYYNNDNKLKHLFKTFSEPAESYNEDFFKNEIFLKTKFTNAKKSLELEYTTYEKIFVHKINLKQDVNIYQIFDEIILDDCCYFAEFIYNNNSIKKIKKLFIKEENKEIINDWCNKNDELKDNTLRLIYKDFEIIIDEKQIKFTRGARSRNNNSNILKEITSKFFKYFQIIKKPLQIGKNIIGNIKIKKKKKKKEKK